MEVNCKTYESGFHYLPEAHELGGKSEDEGYGGPLCKDLMAPRSKRWWRNCERG